MKDLNFSGTLDSNDIDITFRTDMINDSDETFNVQQVMVGDSFETTDEQDADHQALISEFKKINQTISDFKTFATDNNLTLTRRDSVGGNEEILVASSSS